MWKASDKPDIPAPIITNYLFILKKINKFKLVYPDISILMILHYLRHQPTK